MCWPPGQIYKVPGCRDSFASASFTRISVNSSSCAAYWLVNAAGMCCTRITAAGKSFVKPGERRITVAGPPVEAASTTTGNLCSVLAGAEVFDAIGFECGCDVPFAPCTVEA